MTDRRAYTDLKMLELVLIAVYGTWLVSFYDKISFSSSGFYLIAQIILLVIAFVSFITFFFVSMLRPKHPGFITLYAIAGAHCLGIAATGIIEIIIITGAQLQIKLLLFMILGLLIFCLIFGCEVMRTTVARSLARHAPISNYPIDYWKLSMVVQCVKKHRPPRHRERGNWPVYHERVLLLTHDDGGLGSLKLW